MKSRHRPTTATSSVERGPAAEVVDAVDARLPLDGLGQRPLGSGAKQQEAERELPVERAEQLGEPFGKPPLGRAEKRPCVNADEGEVGRDSLTAQAIGRGGFHLPRGPQENVRPERVFPQVIHRGQAGPVQQGEVVIDLVIAVQLGWDLHRARQEQ